MAKQKKGTTPQQKKVQQPIPMDRSSFETFSMLAIILFITLVTFVPMLQNTFQNYYDDSRYITTNSTVLAPISLTNTLAIFSHFRVGNYGPLTEQSWNIDHALFGLNASGYHLHSMILHMINITLIFFISIFLLRKSSSFGKKNIVWIASITALMFAITPMHVESVAWISERKDQLYTLWYLAGLLSYLHYSNNFQKKYLLITGICFLLSLFSKGQAVTFPIILLIIDGLYQRKFLEKTFSERLAFILFFSLSLVFGMIAVIAQSSDQLLHVKDYHLLDRIAFGSYALIQYTWKIFFPWIQSTYYAYPEKTLWIYMSPLVVALAIITGYKLRTIAILRFGSLFYLATIALLLQFIAVGSALMAERYTYLSYFGPFLILATLFCYFYQKQPSFVRTIMTALFTVYMVSWGIKTHSRVKAWKDDTTLAAHDIENVGLGQVDSRIILTLAQDCLERAKYDSVILLCTYKLQTSPFPPLYLLRGRAYAGKGITDSALQDLNMSIMLDTSSIHAYVSRGVIYGKQGQLLLALKDYHHALTMPEGKTPIALSVICTNIADIYRAVGQQDSARWYYQKAAH